MATTHTEQHFDTATQPSWKPRYSVPECLHLLGISRQHFYDSVKAKRYRIVKDGKRTFMTHQQLLDAAGGDEAS